MDDELTRRFLALGADTQSALRLAGSAKVRAASDRRRLRATAGVVAVAAGITVAGGGTILAGLPAGPGQPAAAPPAARFPADFALPHAQDAGWHTDDSLLAPSALPLCRAQEPDPTLVGRTDARTLTGTAPPEVQSHSPTSYTEQVLLFVDARAARTAYGQLRAVPAACSWGSPMVASIGVEDSFRAYTDEASAGPVAAVQRREVKVTVRGNALVISYGVLQGARMSGLDAEGEQAILEQLCARLTLCDPARPSGQISTGAGTPAHS